MYRQLLFENMKGAPPETKFFLLKYLCCYGTRQHVHVKVKDLVGEFGINDRGIKSALEYLLQNKYLTLIKVSVRGPGRPKRLLSPGEILEALVEGWSRIDRKIPHELLIENLLETTPVRQKIVRPRVLASSSAPWPRPKKLTNVRKLLLSTLLANADQCGVVRGISMIELASLIGLSIEQLRWHLKILKGSQYLFHYIPGVAIKGVKGKLKSIFIMSLDRLDKVGAENRGQRLCKSEAMGEFERAVHLAHALKALNGGLNMRAFRRICKSQFAQWSSIYYVDEAQFNNIVNSIELFWGVGDTSGVRYERICAFVGELAASLFVEYGLVNPNEDLLSEKDVARKVAAEAADRKLSLFGAGNRSNNTHGFLWLSKLVLKLYREVSPTIQGSQSASDIRIISCFISPWLRSCDIAVHYYIEQRRG